MLRLLRAAEWSEPVWVPEEVKDGKVPDEEGICSSGPTSALYARRVCWYRVFRPSRCRATAAAIAGVVVTAANSAAGGRPITSALPSFERESDDLGVVRFRGRRRLGSRLDSAIDGAAWAGGTDDIEGASDESVAFERSDSMGVPLYKPGPDLQSLPRRVV